MSEHEQHPATGQCVRCGASGTALIGGCPESEVVALRAKLTKLEALVKAQAKVIAAAQTVVISATLCASPSCKFGLDGYDAVKAELEKVR